MDARVEQVLSAFVEAARLSLGENLDSIVLFGSAAEDRLRATSDVNVIVVLDVMEDTALPGLAAAVRTAHAAIGLSPMFLRKHEIPLAVRAFPVKFADIRRRRRVLHGRDPFDDIVISRADEVLRLQQVLLNFILRTRANLIRLNGRDDELVHVLAGTAGPIRSAASCILELEGNPATDGREATRFLAREHPSTQVDDALEHLHRARETGRLEAGQAHEALSRLLAFAEALYRRVIALEGPWP